MMGSPLPSMDFSTFVLELNQNSAIDYATSGHGSRNCCLPESRLSQEFEYKMSKLLYNYDLNEENKIVIASQPNLRVGNRETDPTFLGFDQNENGVIADNMDCPLDLTVDNDDDQLEILEEELDDSGDAGSSDEQQHSRSLSLSYSLSISHAHENFSQSTDKGLSKRYDSPCSYEDDRESECTNLDKLDDWNDIINDMQNNNNGDYANRDIKEYFGECMGKGQSEISGTGSSEETCDKVNTKELDNASEEVTKHTGCCDSNGRRENDSHPDTPILCKKPSSIEKCHSFLEYRNPVSEYDDDILPTGANIHLLEAGLDNSFSGQSFKRKFGYDDLDDYTYEVTNVIVEKLRKTGVVPDRGCHESISSIGDEEFAQMTKVLSPSKTPTPHNVEEHMNDSLHYIDGATESDKNEYTAATTPTNSRNMHDMFRSLYNDYKNESAEKVS